MGARRTVEGDEADHDAMAEVGEGMGGWDAASLAGMSKQQGKDGGEGGDGSRERWWWLWRLWRG